MRPLSAWASQRLALVAAVLACAGCAAAPSPASRSEQPVGSVRVIDAEIDPRQWLGSAAERAAKAGAGPLEPMEGRIASNGDHLGGFVEVDPQGCLLALARPGPTVADVDLFAFSDGGDMLASDEAPAADATLLICPPHPRRLYVSARVMDGTGPVALGVMPVPAEKAEAVARVLVVRGLPGQDTGKLAAWPGLERTIRERRRALGSSWRDLRRVALPLMPQAPTTLSVPIEPRTCIDALVSPGEEIHSLEMVVLGPDGRVLARAQEAGRARAVVLCSEAAQTVTLVMRPRVASGLAAVVVGRTPRGAAAELSQRTWVDAASSVWAMPEALARHRQAMDSVDLGGAGRLVAQGRATADVPTAVAVSLPQGCARIDVVAARPLGPFEATLWTAAGERLSTARGGASAALFACGRRGRARLEVRSTTLPGPFAVLLRQAGSSPEALANHPRAASRLLRRLDDAVGPVDAQAAAAAQVVSLSAQARTRLPIRAPSRCAEVIAALEQADRGLGMRLVGAAAAEATSARGSSLAAGRLCALRAPLRAEVELGLDAGSSAGLLLVRPLANAPPGGTEAPQDE